MHKGIYDLRIVKKKGYLNITFIYTNILVKKSSHKLQKSIYTNWYNTTRLNCWEVMSDHAYKADFFSPLSMANKSNRKISCLSNIQMVITWFRSIWNRFSASEKKSMFKGLPHSGEFASFVMLMQWKIFLKDISSAFE